ncbi:MAG: hypothetical protein AB2793_11385 [Candidatus Thiodiazotropha sp.]
MDISSAVQAIATAIGIAKDLREIDRSVDEASFKLKLADLTESLADAKVSLVDAQNKLQEKDNEIERIKKAFEFRGTTVTKHGFRYEDRGNGTPQGPPFCPRCETKDGFYILLNQYRGISDLQCPECKSKYHASTYLYPDEG